MQMVMCNLQRLVQWEVPKQSLDHIKWCGTPKYQSISGHTRRRKEYMTTWSTRSELLANQQKDDDSLVRMIVSELLEENRRKTMDGLRLFISVDKYAIVQIGDLQKDMKPKIVTEISFATDFREQLFGKTRMNSFYDHRSFVLFQP